MKPKQTNHEQGRLFDQRLSHQLNPKQELIQLSKEINWKAIEAIVDVYFEKTGRKGLPTRLVIGILMLQQISGLSDEMVVSKWIENPYWQFFCGYDFLQWEFPMDPSTLVRWRCRIGKEGLEKIFAETIQTAKRTQTVKPASLKQAIADTTVMEKNICYPTDGKLYHKMREKLA